MKKVVCIILVLGIVLCSMIGCSTSNANEIEQLKKENEELRKQIAKTSETQIENEASNNDYTKSPEETICISNSAFETLVFEGTGNKIIQNINLPHGIFVATICMNSENHNYVKFHFDVDDYETLVNFAGIYNGKMLAKGSKVSAVENGIMEIKSEGPWQIRIDELSGITTTTVVGSGDMVTGLFCGTGNMDVISVSFISDSYHSLKLYEYDLENELVHYDSLVSEVGKYDGECLVKTKEDRYYFFTISTDEDWSIDFGYDETKTEYYNTAPQEERYNMPVGETIIIDRQKLEDAMQPKPLEGFVLRYNEVIQKYNEELKKDLPKMTLTDAETGLFYPTEWSNFNIHLDESGEIEKLIYMGKGSEMVKSEKNVEDFLISLFAIMKAIDNKISDEQCADYVNGVLEYDLGNETSYSKIVNSYRYEFDDTFGYVRLIVSRE